MDEEVPLLEVHGRSPRRNVMYDLVRGCAAEFAATMVFVFAGTMAVVQGNVIGVALTHGLTIALLVVAFGSISGAHINPAVTLGVLLGGAIWPMKAVMYVFAQLLGGITGAAITRGVLSYEIPNSNRTVYEEILGGGHSMTPGLSVPGGILCEAVLTAILVTAVLMTAVDSNAANMLHPLAIGFAVCIDIIAAGEITGASMNPARSFGPAVVYTSISNELWTNHWVYWVGPSVGAAVAALIYRLIFARSEKRILLKDQ